MHVSKKLAALLLVTIMAFSALTGCGRQNASSNSASTNVAADKTATNETEPDTANAADTQSAQTEDAGPPKPMRYLTPGTMPTDADNALEAINQALQADGVNIEVSFIRIPWDSYEQKLNAMLAAGDPFEMIHIMQDVKNITYLASKEALVPIDEYLPKYPDLVAKFNDKEWSSAVYQGQTYAVPARWQDFSRLYGQVIARGDTMKQVTNTPPETAEDFLEVSKQMQVNIEAEVGKKPYFWMHQLPSPPSFLHRTYNTWPFYVEMSLGLVMIREDGTVDSYFESEEFKKDAMYFREMYTSGLIHPDVLNIDHTSKYDEFKIGCALPSNTFGWSDQVPLQENIPTAYVEAFFLAPEKKKLIYTLSQNLNGMSATAEDPESGLQFLDWIYANKENHDLFFYGVEGVHYTASAPNRIKQIRGADNNPLYAFDTWMAGYMPYLRFDEAFPEEGIEAYTTSLPEEDLVYSPAAAFLFDASNVQSELTNLQTEIMSSFYPIKFGLVNYDDAYPAAIKNLKEAGLDAYLEEYRSQFNAFLEQ